MTTIAPTRPELAAFPAVAVEACLRDELIEVVKSETAIRGTVLPADQTKLVQTPVEIDSLTVVDVLCAVEPILGFELRERVVRAGGYESVESALQHMMPRIEHEWQRKKGSKQ